MYIRCTHAHTYEEKLHKPKYSKEIVSKNKEDKHNLMYASGGNPKDNDGESEVEKFPDPNEPGIPPSERTKRRIIRHLKRLGMLDVERINENAVRIVIGIEVGYDPRTINRYFDSACSSRRTPFLGERGVDKDCTGAEGDLKSFKCF